MTATQVAPTSPCRLQAVPSRQHRFSASPLQHCSQPLPHPVASGPHTHWDRLHFTPQIPLTVQTPPLGEGELPSPLPDPQRFAGLAARCAAEILAGYRPVEQMTRWLSPELYAALTRRAGLAMRLLGSPRSRRCLHVRSTRLFTVSRSAYEATVLLDDGRQVRAVALRIEARAQRWIVTHLDIG